MQRKIMLVNDEVATPTVWSFLRTECGIEHITANERDLCTDCAANGKIWSALMDLGEVPDALAQIHELAGQAIFDKMHQALHDSVCDCGGAYGRSVSGKIEMLCERFKNRVCYIHDFCVCAGECCGNASCGCDEDLCLCAPSACYDGPSLRVLFEDDEEDGPYPHVCGEEGMPVDEGACAARLMLFCAMQREEPELLGALQDGEPRFSAVSGMVAQRAASIAGGIFLGDTLYGVPHNVSTERARRFFSCELSERDKRGLTPGTLAYQAVIRPVIVSFMDCIDEALRKSPLAEALRGEICWDDCCVPGGAPQASLGDSAQAPNLGSAESANAARNVLSVVDGRLVVPCDWAPAMLMSGLGGSPMICGFTQATPEGIAYSGGACGDEERCSWCVLAAFVARHVLERAGTDMFFAQMEAIDAAIDVINKDIAERLAALCGGESSDCYGDLEYRAADVEPSIVGAVSGCAATTAMMLIHGVVQGNALQDVVRDIVGMWSDALRETELCDAAPLDDENAVEERKGRLAAYSAGVEMAQAIGARFAAGNIPGYAGDPAFA